jgi:hypothetical protein
VGGTHDRLAPALAATLNEQGSRADRALLFQAGAPGFMFGDSKVLAVWNGRFHFTIADARIASLSVSLDRMAQSLRWRKPPPPPGVCHANEAGSARHPGESDDCNSPLLLWQPGRDLSPQAAARQYSTVINGDGGGYFFSAGDRACLRAQDSRRLPFPAGSGP